MAQARQGCETVERFLTSSRHAKHLSKDEYDKTHAACEQLRERLAKLNGAPWPP